MTDWIYAGATWRRTVTINDANGPVDPTDLTAVVCPEIRPTLTRLAAGSYEIMLAEAQTADLIAGPTHWELWGRIGADLTMITRQPVTVTTLCGP